MRWGWLPHFALTPTALPSGYSAAVGSHCTTVPRREEQLRNDRTNEWGSAQESCTIDTESPESFFLAISSECFHSPQYLKGDSQFPHSNRLRKKGKAHHTLIYNLLLFSH